MAKVVITKDYRYPASLSVTFFRDEFSRGQYQGDSDNLREAVKKVDSFKFMKDVPIDVCHRHRHGSSWHKIR